MVRASLDALSSHWRRHPMQFAMLLLGLSLATALWSGVQAINAEARASYDRAAAVLGGNRLSQLVTRDGALFDQNRFIALRRAGWLVSPVLEGDLKIGSATVHLIGIDPVSIPTDANVASVASGTDLLPFIRPPGIMYVNSITARALARQTSAALHVDESLPPGTALVDIGIAQTLLDHPRRLSRLIVADHQPSARDRLEDVAPDLSLQAPDPQSDLTRLTDSFHLNLTAFGFLAFAVGLFIVYSAIGLAFEQRRSTFRTLRALGLSAVVLTGLLLAELLAVSVFAGLVGVALGYLIASLLLPGVAATLQGLYGATLPGTLTLRTEWWVAGLGIAVLGALGSAGQSLWQVWRMPLLAPAQPRAWAVASGRTRQMQAVAAALLLASAAMLVHYGSGLIAGFAVLGGLLLGSALLLPVALSLLLAVFEAMARRPLVQWFWADARQQLPGLSLALMALLLALSANVGVGTMVASFRLTFEGFLDQRLAAQLYVTARTEKEASAMRVWLEGRVDAVLPIWSTDGRILGQPAEVIGVKDDRLYRENWRLLSGEQDAWDKVAAGKAAMINEQMARREGLRPGDRITLPRGWQTEIAGVYSDYGNPIGQAIVGVDALVSHYPDVPKLRFGLRVDQNRAAALARELRKRFGLPAQSVIDQASLKRKALDVFETTFAVTGVLNVLTLGVAGIAMFASLMTLSSMRLPQIAPVWAMGVTQRTLVLLELARTMGLALFTLLAALPVGIALAWVLLAVVNVEAFGWRLPLFVFPMDWLRLGVYALLAAFLACLAPLRHMARIAPSELLKVFANER
ncbi:MAG: attG [Bradyrhizobium sp.]|nr:attG [Bradyrhizobium sp.]